MSKRSNRIGEEVARLFEEYGAIPKGENEAKVDDEPRMISKEDVKNVFDAARRKFIIEYKEKVESDPENKEEYKATLMAKLSSIDFRQNYQTSLKDKITSRLEVIWMVLPNEIQDILLVQLVATVISIPLTLFTASLCETLLEIFGYFLSFVSLINLIVAVLGSVGVVLSLFKRERITALDIVMILVSFTIGIPAIILII